MQADQIEDLDLGTAFDDQSFDNIDAVQLDLGTGPTSGASARHCRNPQTMHMVVELTEYQSVPHRAKNDGSGRNGLQVLVRGQPVVYTERLELSPGWSWCQPVQCCAEKRHLPLMRVFGRG
jgi:hypothetical protein